MTPEETAKILKKQDALIRVLHTQVNELFKEKHALATAIIRIKEQAAKALEDM